MSSAGTGCRAQGQGVSDGMHLLEYCCPHACFVDWTLLSPKQFLGIPHLPEKLLSAGTIWVGGGEGYIWGREEEQVWDSPCPQGAFMTDRETGNQRMKVQRR